MPTSNSSNFANNDELRALWKAAVVAQMTGNQTANVNAAMSNADVVVEGYMARVDAAEPPATA